MQHKTEKLMKIKKAEIQSGGFPDRVALACEFGDARYHIWIDRKTLEMEPEIYKNPARDLRRDHPDYFNTRKLRRGSEFTDGLVAAMFHALKTDDLLAKCAEKDAKAEAERLEKAHEEYRQECIRNAAPALLEALNEAAHECANATVQDLERLKDLAQKWVKLTGKCDGREMLTKEGRQTVKDVIEGIKNGATFAWIAPEHRDGDYDIRLDFPNGNHWFLSKTVLKTLRRRGVKIPTA